MSTITKEWLLKTIEELEEERDATPGAVNEDAGNAMAAMKIALASLEAEPVGFIARHKETGKFGSYLHPKADWFKNDDYEVMMAYTAPPAPVVPDEKPVPNPLKMYAVDAVAAIAEVRGWNACRAAMLQGAEPVTTANKLPAIGWLRADYQDDNRGLRGNAPLFVLGKKDPSTVWGLDYIPLTSNSPVVLDGTCPCCGRKQLRNRTCSVFGCDGKHVAHGFCKKHYDIERKKDPSRRESIRAADKRYRARKAVVPHQEVR